MILQALVEHYENLAEQGKISQPGWCSAKVSYAIELVEDGSVKAVVPMKFETDAGKKKVFIPSPMTVPEMVTRSSGVSANFLCDNAKYILGIEQNVSSARVLECFDAAKERHLAILDNVDSKMARAICLFFRNWKPEEAKENEAVCEHWDELNDGGNLVFCMGKNFAQDDAMIKKAWEESLNGDEEETTGICLVTGKRDRIARIHKLIKGVAGAQSSGAALVSFNAQSFESYGKEQSYNAPVGKYAEFAYTTALNYLLAQRDYKYQLGDSTVVFWSESGEKEYQDTFLLSIDPPQDNQEEIKKVFDSLKNNRWVDLNDINMNSEKKFYILCLAPNAARLSVRFFYQDSFGNILQNIAAHYERMNIIRPSMEKKEYLGMRWIMREIVNMKSSNKEKRTGYISNNEGNEKVDTKSNAKNPFSNMEAMVLRSILSNDRYPASLYTDVIMRTRAEQGNVTYGRAAIIKAYLIKNYKWKEGEKYMALNEACNEPAYILGRLFAVLEGVQKDANRDIKATIRDRYFNSACATPATVFPILLKLKNSHIRKLERDNGYKKRKYEDAITELIGKLDMTDSGKGMPSRLSLEEQGKFMLGYYHQRYEKKEDK